MPVQTRIQIRRGTTSEWNDSLDPLSQGELGYDLSLKKFKVGDGTSLWSSLPWATIVGSDLVGTSGINISYASASGVATVSVTGLTSSYLSDFASAVSGLLPVKNIVAGTNIAVSGDNNGTFTISTNGLDSDAVKDVVGITITGVSGISAVYNNTTKVETISITGLTSSYIGDFNSSVSGLLPVKNVSAGSGISVSSANGDFTVSLSDPTIQLSDITDLTSDARSFLLTPSSTNLSALVTDETGSGLLVFNSGATLNNVTLAGTVTIGSDSLSETIDDRVSNLLTTGSGIGLNYNDSSNTLQVSVTGIPTSLITNFASGVNTLIENAVSASIVGGSGVDIVYNSGTNTLTISSALTAGSGISLTHNSGNYTVSVTGHSHSWSQITDASQKATLTELGYLSGVTPGTSSANRALVVDSNKDLTGVRNLTTEGNITVGGDLVVQGTTTTVNSTTVDIGDNIIKVNTSGLNTGGIEVYTGSDTKSLVWNTSNNRWEFTGGNIYTSGNFISDSLQVSSNSLVSNLNADLLDSQHGSYYRDFVNLTGVPSPIITGILTGDIAGTGTVTLNQLGNGTLSVNTNIVAGSITNSDISSSAGIDVTKLSSSGITIGSTTINLGNTVSGLVGLSSISGTSAGSPTTLYYCVIDGGTP